MKKTIMAFSVLIASQAWAAPSIEIGLLLDSSGSMSGLINQTRNKVWKLMNELDKARKDGEVPEVKIGLYSYGNGNHPDAVQEIVKISGLTTDHDTLSEDFFKLQATGGSELAGTVVKQALSDLHFSDDADFKALYLAGNETLKQGEILIEDSAKEAVDKDVLLNTIFAQVISGGFNIPSRFPPTRHPVPAPVPQPAPIPAENPIYQEWKQAAEIGLGSFHHINSNAKEVYIEAPQDKLIVELNKKLNTTYVPYGKNGLDAYNRMITVDGSSSNAGGNVIVGRGRYKVGSHYNVSKWDLVDAYKKDAKVVSSLKDEELPKELKGKTVDFIIAFITAKDAERTAIKAEVKQLYKDREVYVAKKKEEMAKEGDVDTLEQAMVNSLKEQLKEKGFSFDE